MIFPLLSLAALIISTLSYGQEEGPDMSSKASVPVYYVDSVLVDQKDIVRTKPEDIASFKRVSEKRGQQMLGDKGKNGIIFIETKTFARKKYWTYFTSKSADYLKVVPAPGNDKLIQYVLNGRVLKSDFEGELSALNDKTFRRIDIVPKDTLLKRFGIFDKIYGVIITSEPRPVNPASKKAVEKQ
jgi:hypothetical protein